MTRSFNSFGALAVHLVERAVAVPLALEEGLHKVAKKIERTAKDEIGHYQSAVGPFQGWDDLADSTEERKAALGYPADAPLLAAGAMQESITHEVRGLEAAIGSTDQNLLYQEMGTTKIPPRPVLGPAAFHNRGAIELLMGAAAVSGLIGGDAIHAALGYDMAPGGKE